MYSVSYLASLASTHEIVANSRLSCDNQKCVPMPPIFSTPMETHSVALWCPFTLTCQDHSFLSTTTFALDLLSKRLILLLIFHCLGHFLQEHLPIPILIISHELKLLSLLPCPYIMRRGFYTSHSPLYIGT